jgi:hypothetical protein
VCRYGSGARSRECSGKKPKTRTNQRDVSARECESGVSHCEPRAVERGGSPAERDPAARPRESKINGRDPSAAESES